LGLGHVKRKASGVNGRSIKNYETKRENANWFEKEGKRSSGQGTEDLLLSARETTQKRSGGQVTPDGGEYRVRYATSRMGTDLV